nr:MAG TPA: hypothetical protein [Caudoviricetes sp.]
MSAGFIIIVNPVKYSQFSTSVQTKLSIRNTPRVIGA